MDNSSVFYKHLSIDNFELLSPPLGTGAYGKVYLAIDFNTYQRFACKRIEIEDLEGDSKLQSVVLKEVINSLGLNHVNVNKLRFIKKTPRHINFFFDYCDSKDLKWFHQKHQRVFEKQPSIEIVRHIAKQLIEGMIHLKENGIVHRDLKLDNILFHSGRNYGCIEECNLKLWLDVEEMLIDLPLFDEIPLLKLEVEIDGTPDLFSITDYDKFEKKVLASNVKIADLGLSTNFFTETPSGLCGTPSTMAPEVAKNNSEKIDYNEKCDIWSLGCIIFKLVTGKNPIEGRKIKELFENVKRGKMVIPEGFYTLELLDFLSCLMQLDPKERIELEKCLDHEFFTWENEVIELKMKRYVSLVSQSIQEALNSPKLGRATENLMEFYVSVLMGEEEVKIGKNDYVLINLNVD